MGGAALVQSAAFLMRPASAYQALELGLPPAWVGLIGAAFAVVPLFLAVPVGRSVDRWSERPLLVLGSVGIVTSGLVFLVFGNSLIGLVVGNGLLGAGHLAGNVAGQAFLANRVSGNELDRQFGMYAFMSSFGQAVGPLAIVAGGSNAVDPDTTPMFQIGLVVAVAMLVCSASVKARGASHREQAATPPTSGTLSLLRIPGLAKAVVASGITVAAVDLTLIYLPVLGAERALSAGVVSALLSARAVASMASRLGFSRIVGYVGRKRVMVVTTAVAALCLALCAIPMPVPLLFIAISGAGFGLGMNLPLTMVWVSDLTPDGRRGQTVALRLAANRIGQVSLPGLLGASLSHLGVGVLFGGIAAVVGSTLALLRGERIGDD